MTNFWRQLDILNPNLIVFPVTVIGAGGIGRHTVETLAQMGCKDITVYDFDLVEEHNRPSQSYRKDDIGRLKVDALKEIVGQFAEWCEIRIIPEKFEKQKLEGIVISGVDSIEMEKRPDSTPGRKEIWKAIRYNPDVPLYIDGRLGGENIQVHTIKPCNPRDVEFYEKTLHSKEESAQLACTAQNIIYVGKIISGLIASQVKKWLKKEEYCQRIYFDIATLGLLCWKDGKLLE